MSVLPLGWFSSVIRWCPHQSPASRLCGRVKPPCVAAGPAQLLPPWGLAQHNSSAETPSHTTESMLKLVSILFLHTSIPAMSGWVDLFWLSDQPTGICCFYCNILWRRSLVPKRVNPNFVVIMLYRLYRLERTCLGVFISSPINISFTVLQPNQYILQFCNGTFLGGGGEVSVGGGGGGEACVCLCICRFPALAYPGRRN